VTTDDDSEKDPLPGKLRLILQSRVKEAKAKEDRERAEEELRKFVAATSLSE